MQLKNPRSAPAPAAHRSTQAQAQAAERHWQRGVDFARREDWPSAERAFQAATDASPHDALLRVNLARAQLKAERLAAALENARAVLAQAPDHAIARDIAAECLNRLG